MVRPRLICALLAVAHINANADAFMSPAAKATSRLILRAEVESQLSSIKQTEAALRAQLAAVQREKATVLATRKLTIGIVGFGKFGQFLAGKFREFGHDVRVLSRSDRSAEATAHGAVGYHALGDAGDVASFFAEKPDVVVLAVSIVSFEATLAKLAPALKEHPGTVLVDVLSVKEHARKALLKSAPASTSILCTHPMFGPESGKNGWTGLTFVYERVRVAAGADDVVERFLSVFESAGCAMVEMSCRQHDVYAANSQFLTHLVGRMLGSIGRLHPTPIDTKGFESVLKIVETTCDDSFDLFYGLYRYNPHSKSTLLCLRKAMADIELRLISLELDGDAVPDESDRPDEPRGTLDHLDLRESAKASWESPAWLKSP